MNELVKAGIFQVIEEYGLDVQFHGTHWRVFQSLHAKKRHPTEISTKGTVAP